MKPLGYLLFAAVLGPSIANATALRLTLSPEFFEE